MLEQPLRLLTPEDKKIEEYQKMRKRIEAVKAKMRVVANDPSLSKEEKLKIIEETFLPKLERAQRFRKKGEIPEIISADWQNPETGETKEISINFEQEITRFEEFYLRHFNIALDRSKIQEIIQKNLEEMKEEIEKYGYDAILVIPENLPENEELNEKLIETMEEEVEENGRKEKKKVAKTYQWENFKNNGSWQGAKSAEVPKTRIILLHSSQNLKDHPLLKATQGKSVPELTGLSQEEIQKRIQNKEPLPVNFQGTVENQKKEKINVPIEAEGLSMEEYLVFQRIFFEKEQKHLDEQEAWTRLLKSRLASLVANAYWHPGNRQLSADADGPEYRHGNLGCRLSRSFSKS